MTIMYFCSFTEGSSLSTSNHPTFNIYIKDEAYVTSIPEFVVMKEEGIVDRAFVVIEVCMSLMFKFLLSSIHNTFCRINT